MNLETWLRFTWPTLASLWIIWMVASFLLSDDDDVQH